MKSIKKIILAIILVFPLIMLTAQTPPHPNGGGGPGGGNIPVGGGAPVDGGLLVMLSLAAGYGIRKVNDKRNKAARD